MFDLLNFEDSGCVSKGSWNSDGDEKDKKDVYGVMKYGSFSRKKYIFDDSESCGKIEYK